MTVLWRKVRLEGIALLYRVLQPAPPLSSFVALLWYWQDSGTPHGMERLLPDGSQQIVLNLVENRVTVNDGRDPSLQHTFADAVVCGARSDYFSIETRQKTEVIGAHCHPGGLRPLLGIPSDELHNRHVALGDCWHPNAVRLLREQVLAAPTPEAKLRCFEQALLRHGRRPLERHPAVAWALAEFTRDGHDGRVAHVIQQTGFSTTRLTHLFRDEIGLTPKLFCRLRRFQHALREIQSASRIDWARLAAGCGYYDQAHLIRDFHSFAGLSPSEYFARKTPHLNHVPLD